MGYSGRYHAASLVAVFIALAIGIVIGIGLAHDVISGASKELENSLRGDLEDARAQAEDLQQQLDREQQFSSRAFPALVNGLLDGQKIAIVGIGGLSDETDSAVEAALDPTGADIAAKAVIAMPPDSSALAGAAGPRWSGARRGGPELARLGHRLGVQISGGGGLIRAAGSQLFSRFSGRLDGVDMVVVAPGDLSGLDPAERTRAQSLLSGLYSGIKDGADGSVAVELTSTEPSVLGGPSQVGMATVDHADLTAGKTAIVYSLLGAEGDYGTREGDDSFLPELLVPSASP